MKKTILILAILTMISCKNTEHRAIAIAEKTDSIQTETTIKKADTISFTYNEKWKSKDIALVYLLDKKYSKDSICTATFRIDFKDPNRVTTFSKIFKIKGVDEGAEWSGGLELDSIASPLKRVDYGYPACGYTQNHFLFYVNGKNSNLVHEWYSNGDSGWGYWSEVVSGTPEDFYFRTENFSPVEESNQSEGYYEYGLNEYFDSIHFKLENSKWKKTLLTPKDKAYRSRKVKFDDFYKQN